jgi:hypothetical protein
VNGKHLGFVHEQQQAFNCRVAREQLIEQAEP